MMKRKLPPARDWNEGLTEDLKDPIFASEFILGALAQGASVEEVLSKVTSHLSTGSVFRDLGFNETESETLEMKATLIILVSRLVKQRGFKQRDLETLLNQPKPQIRGLVHIPVVPPPDEQAMTLGNQIKKDVGFQKRKRP